MSVDHPIFARWPAEYPDRLQLFSAPTPNGVKVGIMPEETGLPYEAQSSAGWSLPPFEADAIEPPPLSGR